MGAGLQAVASALGAGLLLLLSGPEALAQQCVPAVANPSAYERCHLRKVHRQEVCRCALVSAELPKRGEARAAVAWGALTTTASDWTTRSLTLEGYSSPNSAAQSVSPFASGGGDNNWRDSGGANDTNTASASVAPDAGTANAQPATASAATPSSPEPGTAVPGLGIVGPNGSIRSDNIPAPVNP